VSEGQTSTLAEAWKHKYNVLQGKYNAETRELRQALMHRDASNRNLRVELSRLGTRAKIAETEHAYWKGHSTRLGIAASVLAVLALALCVLVHKYHERPEACPPIAWDPNIMQLPPTYIEAHPAQPTVEL